MCWKRSLFKNDLFGIKEKMFMWRITKSIRMRNYLLAHQLECLLNIAMNISIPKTEEEAAKLEKVYDTYQSLTSEVENDMKHMHDKIYDWRND